jgi:DNA-directed RNA polymerase subunit K/omega
MEENYEDDDYVESDNESETEETTIRVTSKKPVTDEDSDQDGEDEVEGKPPNLEKDIFDVDTEDEDDEEDDEDEDQEEEDIEASLRNTVAEQGRTAFTDLDNLSEDEEDEENDEHYLQKFDEANQRKVIADYHPELQSHNYDEIDLLSRIVRDENGQIVDPLHKTLPFITRYEKARILGERAKQLNSGAKSVIDVDPNIIDGYLIALKEYEKKAIPFIVKRPLPNGGCEYWKFEDLEHIE